MKRMLLSLSFVLALLKTGYANQQLNFSAQLFYNSTRNTITIQLWITNSAHPDGNGCGTSQLYIAGVDFALEYNPAVLSLRSWMMLPSGQQLDYPGDYFNGSSPVRDTTIFSTRYLSNYSRTDSTIEFIRTTNLCANTIYLNCESSYPLFEATFYINPSLIPVPYDVTHPNDSNYPNYIAEFSGYYTNGPNNGQIMPPSNSYKQLFFNIPPSIALKSPGSTCNTTTVGNNVPSINDDPVIPDLFYNSNAPLPLNLSDYVVYEKNNQNILEWQTNGEINCKGFEVQKRISNEEFKTVGYVQSKAPGGFSEQRLSYVFADNEHNNPGMVYYRLKQLNYFNTESYSDIRSLRVGKYSGFLLYPNPSSGIINVVLPSNLTEADLAILDYSGKTIQTWKNYQKQILTISNLNKGFYLMIAKSKLNGEIHSRKFTVQ